MMYCYNCIKHVWCTDITASSMGGGVDVDGRGVYVIATICDLTVQFGVVFYGAILFEIEE